jgi:DNA-binding response OmpR family regulator
MSADEQARLLAILDSRPGHVFTKDELVRRLDLTSSRALDDLVAATRSRCATDGRPAPKNIWGVGFKVDAP